MITTKRTGELVTISIDNTESRIIDVIGTKSRKDLKANFELRLTKETAYKLAQELLDKFDEILSGEEE